MAEKLKDIVDFLDRYLLIDEIPDFSFNGLQVEGSPEVKKIMFTVDSGMEIFKKALDERADMVIVHHGIFWQGDDPRIRGLKKEHVDFLLRNNISLYAAHLPLDKHFDVGNNVQLLKLLGAKVRRGFLEHEGHNIGWIGEFKPSLSLKDIEIRLSAELGAKCTILPFGKENISTIAVCSGAGGRSAFKEALKEDADVFLTGEITEIYQQAKDEKLNVVFAGHHATETTGVKALSQLVRKKLKVDTVFIDVPTGL